MNKCLKKEWKTQKRMKKIIKNYNLNFDYNDKKFTNYWIFCVEDKLVQDTKKEWIKNS